MPELSLPEQNKQVSSIPNYIIEIIAQMGKNAPIVSQLFSKEHQRNRNYLSVSLPGKRIYNLLVGWDNHR
jgi:hypothetical protein